MNSSLSEVWLRGPLPAIPALLQPVAHALMQAREEVDDLLKDFPDHLLWERPAGVASVAFHLQHMTGVLDRLFTYAAGNALNENQLQFLKAEGVIEPSITVKALVISFGQQVEISIRLLAATDAQSLTEKRGVGRAQLPSTVIGLLTHAAEHSMRHMGQLLVTVKIVKAFDHSNH